MTGGILAFVWLSKFFDDVCLVFGGLCGMCVMASPVVGVYFWLRELRRERDEEIEAAMAFDKRLVHGTAGIATPDEQRLAGL